MQPACYRGFSAAKILPNPKLKNKRKFFIGGFSKQYDFASQEFLVVRGNGWGFLWSGRHTRRWKGWGCVTGHGIGHVDIQVGSCNCLDVIVCHDMCT